MSASRELLAFCRGLAAFHEYASWRTQPHALEDADREAQPAKKQRRAPRPCSPEYLLDWVRGEKRTALETWLRSEPMTCYMFRGKRMKRAPNREYYYPGHETTTYRWGQQKIMYPGGPEYTGEEMPAWMVAMADTIRETWGERVNHAILTRYAHGTDHHSPPHKDKIKAHTGFFLVSFGTPRLFEFRHTELRAVTKKGQTKLKEVPGEVAWARDLAPCSMLVVTPRMNREYFHALPRTRLWEGEPRYSLIFRTIV